MIPVSKRQTSLLLFCYIGIPILPYSGNNFITIFINCGRNCEIAVIVESCFACLRVILIAAALRRTTCTLKCVQRLTDILLCCRDHITTVARIIWIVGITTAISATVRICIRAAISIAVLTACAAIISAVTVVIIVCRVCIICRICITAVCRILLRITAVIQSQTFLYCCKCGHFFC